MVWTVLLEVLGLAATCGPMAFHFDPPIGGVLYWWQQDTLRVPPYPNHVPLTKGDRRTPWDSGLYKLIVFWLIMMLFLSGDDMRAFLTVAQVMPQWALVVCGAHHRDGLQRQDYFPVFSGRAVRPHDALLRPFHELRRHGHRSENLHCDHLDVRWFFQVQPWILINRFDHGPEHPVGSLGQVPQSNRQGLPQRHSALESCPCSRSHRRDDLRDRDAACSALLAMALDDLVAIVSIWMLHTFIVSAFPLAVPLNGTSSSSSVRVSSLQTSTQTTVAVRT